MSPVQPDGLLDHVYYFRHISYVFEVILEVILISEVI